MNLVDTTSSRVGWVALAALAVASVGACSKDVRTLESEKPIFAAPDSGTSEGGCALQCSVDGRAVVNVCSNGTSSIVEECSATTACGDAVCQAPCAAAAVNKSSNGCEFFFQAPHFTSWFRHSCYAAFVVNTSAQEATLSLEYEGQPIDISSSTYRTTPGSAELTPFSGPVPPGESVIVFVSDRDRRAIPAEPGSEGDTPCPTNVNPATYIDNITYSGIGAAFHLTADVPVSLATSYPFGGAAGVIPTAALLLPVTSWSTENIIVNGWEKARALPGFNEGNPATMILAAEDDTQVTIVPNADVQRGVGFDPVVAGTPLKVTLGKGQTMQLVQTEELTGSFVSSNKPVAMVGGNACGNVPTTVGTCDVLAQQIPAPQNWGSEYVGVGYRPRLRNEHEPVPYRIVAARDGTLLEYDPPTPPAGAPVALSAGESKIFYAGTGDAFVVRTQDAEHPIYVAAYMTGQTGAGGHGDAEFVNVVPTAQYMSSYGFYADASFAENALTIVRAKSGGSFEDVTLECAGVLTDWRPIGTRGEFEFTRLDISRSFQGGDFNCKAGLQRMQSAGPFSATLWGWAPAASYAYPSGTAMRKLVTETFAPPQ